MEIERKMDIGMAVDIFSYTLKLKSFKNHKWKLLLYYIM